MYKKLIAVATGEIKHAGNGLCPDPIEGFDSRDPDCSSSVGRRSRFPPPPSSMGGIHHKSRAVAGCGFFSVQILCSQGADLVLE